MARQGSEREAVEMTKLWKLTDKNDQTYGGCQWGVGIEHGASGEGVLCGPGWLHAYTDPLLAVFLNPMHRDFDPETYHLWEVEGDVGREDRGLKVGCTRLRVLCRVDPPEVTTEQRVRFAILCTLQVCEDLTWRTWAEKWLSGEDRSMAAAEAARAAAEAAGAAVWVAWAAARAAVWAARAAEATEVAEAAEAAVKVVVWAAQAAARAAEAAEIIEELLPLAEIAKEAIQEDRGSN